MRKASKETKKTQDSAEPKRKRGRPRKPESEKSKIRKRKVGRPKKKKPRPKIRKKKREFEETGVGHFLMYEAPLEYELILKANPTRTPSADLIEQVGYASLNPLFKKPKFRRALKEYRQHGLYLSKVRVSSVENELYYMKIRNSKK